MREKVFMVKCDSIPTCVLNGTRKNDSLVKHPTSQDRFRTFGNDNSLFQGS